MLNVFLWASALPHRTWFGVGGVAWKLRGLWNSFSSASQGKGFSIICWICPLQSGKVQGKGQKRIAQNFCNLIRYLGEVHVFSAELRLLKARFCVILHHSRRRKWNKIFLHLKRKAMQFNETHHFWPGARYWCTQLKITHSLALVNLFKIRSRWYSARSWRLWISSHWKSLCLPLGLNKREYSKNAV